MWKKAKPDYIILQRTLSETCPKDPAEAPEETWRREDTTQPHNQTISNHPEPIELRDAMSPWDFLVFLFPCRTYDVQLMEGCWECLRVDLVKLCCFPSVFPWKKNETARFRGSGAVTLWPCFWKRYAWAFVSKCRKLWGRSGQRCLSWKTDQHFSVFVRLKQWLTTCGSVCPITGKPLRQEERWESRKVGKGTIDFHWLSARTVGQMQQLSRRFASKLGGLDKDGFVQMVDFKYHYVQDSFLQITHIHTTCFVWRVLRSGTRRNPKYLTRTAQCFVFTTSVSGISKSHFSNESPVSWRMLGVGLGQSCPGILQS